MGQSGGKGAGYASLMAAVQQPGTQWTEQIPEVAL